MDSTSVNQKVFATSHVQVIHRNLVEEIHQLEDSQDVMVHLQLSLTSLSLPLCHLLLSAHLLLPPHWFNLPEVSSLLLLLARFLSLHRLVSLLRLFLLRLSRVNPLPFLPPMYLALSHPSSQANLLRLRLQPRYLLAQAFLKFRPVFCNLHPWHLNLLPPRHLLAEALLKFHPAFYNLLPWHLNLQY